MTDIEIIHVLEKRIGQPFPHTILAGRCIELSLCHKDAIFFGLIRHQSPAAKQEIIKLISRLTGLRILDLRRNRLGVLPPEFSQLTDLEHLNLSSNYLGGFPDHIRNFRRLKSLYLGNNDLVELPAQGAGLFEAVHVLGRKCRDREQKNQTTGRSSFHGLHGCVFSRQRRFRPADECVEPRYMMIARLLPSVHRARLAAR